MEIQSIVGTLLLFFTAMVTYKGFIDQEYFDEYKFHVDKILISKEYRRTITSGFLHVGWFHFGFNMIALLSFSMSVENTIGWQLFLFLYFASMLGGSLLALYIHRNHGDYSAAGASGAISGIVMASILINPYGGIGIILLPYFIPSWIFGLLFVLITILAIKAQSDNIGHEAHLGGALTGALLIAIIKPDVAFQNWWIFLLIVVPTTLFLILISKRPDILITKKWNLEFNITPSSKKKRDSKKSKLHRKNDSGDEELNRLLDKIKKEGISSLSQSEKDQLDKFREDL